MSLRDAVVEFRHVPVQLIDAPELPARAEMDEGKMDELIADVKTKGVLVPLSLVRVRDRYEVVAGHRRRIAAERASVLTVPALVYAEKTAALEAVKWSENRFREEMSVAEEATYFAELLERDCGGDTNKLAELLGEKRSYIEGRLLLFQGAAEVFDALAQRKITIGVAHELNKCDEKLMRDYYLDCAIRQGATIGLVANWIEQWRHSRGPCTATDDATPAASTPGPVPQTNFFTCIACGESDDVHLMQPVNVHTHGRKAVLDKALALYARRADVVLWPRTVDEAMTLANQVIERFPEIVKT